MSSYNTVQCPVCYGKILDKEVLTPGVGTDYNFASV